eukprot:jgi/Mesen1/5455/ME000273S04707
MAQFAKIGSMLAATVGAVCVYEVRLSHSEANFPKTSFLKRSSCEEGNQASSNDQAREYKKPCRSSTPLLAPQFDGIYCYESVISARR